MERELKLTSAQSGNGVWVTFPSFPDAMALYVSVVETSAKSLEAVPGATWMAGPRMTIFRLVPSRDEVKIYLEDRWLRENNLRHSCVFRWPPTLHTSSRRSTIEQLPLLH